MKSHRTFFLLFSAILCVGCATQNYVEPEGPDVATLTFQNKSDSDIWITAFKVPEDCSGGMLKFANNSTLPAGDELSVKIRANLPFSLWLFYSPKTLLGLAPSCRIPATFTPKPEHRYIARFISSREKSSACYFSIFAVSPTGESIEPTFRIRNRRFPFFDSGSFCDKN
jgi:hypothetical protein